ncbi:hypothetical protein D9758_018773, partial [Tetrapyrgos nigripes]
MNSLADKEVEDQRMLNAGGYDLPMGVVGKESSLTSGEPPRGIKRGRVLAETNQKNDTPGNDDAIVKSRRVEMDDGQHFSRTTMSEAHLRSFEKLEAKLEEYKKKVRELDATNIRQSDKIDSLARAVDRLETTQKTMEAQKRKIAEQHEALEDQFNRYQKEQELKSKLADRKKKTPLQEGEISYSTKIDKLDAEAVKVKILKAEVAELRQELQELQVYKLNAEQTDAESAKLQNEKQELGKLRERYEAENEKHVADLLNAKTDLTTAKEEKSKLQEERDRVQGGFNNLRDEKKKLREANDTLRNDLGVVTKDRDGLQPQIALEKECLEAIGNARQSELDSRKAKDELAKVQQDRDHFQGRHTKAQDDKKLLQQAKNTLQKETVDLRSEKSKLESLNSSLRQSEAMAQDDLKKIQEERDGLKADLTKLREEKDKLLNDLKKVEAATNKLKDDLMKANEENEVMKIDTDLRLDEDDTMDELRTRVADLENDLQESRISHGNCEDIICELTEEVDELDRKVKALEVSILH